MSEITDRLDETGDDGGAPPPRQRPPAAVATSHPAAVRAAARVLEEGGLAVDAAVCAAACLGVVEPMSTGVGGDLFAQVWRADGTGGAVHDGYNGSGAAPGGLDLDQLRARHGDAIPERHPDAVTVPGAVAGWADLLDRHGRRDLGAILAPAILLARDGFEVTPAIATSWAAHEDVLRAGHGTGALLPGGRAPRAGERFAWPALGETLARIAADGPAALYEGPIAGAIAKTVSRLGGTMERDDLVAHRGRWVAPMEVAYRGHPIAELPPNGQGLVVLEALGILEDYPLADLSPVERTHLQIEALKLAFADADRWVGDPDHLPRPVAGLLTEEALEARRALIGDTARATAPPSPVGSDTVYVAVADGEGGVCSLIQSLYMPFGTAIVAGRDAPGDTGILLQNRGALFRLEAGHPNTAGPGRRPRHTILPALAFRAGRPALVFGVVGGFQQPQGQVQLLVRAFDEGLSLEEAVSAPRFRWVGGRTVWVEEPFPEDVAKGLVARGHEVVRRPRGAGFGGAQAVAIDPFTLEGQAVPDPRGDGLGLVLPPTAGAAPADP